jgi:hypothetical protein
MDFLLPALYLQFDREYLYQILPIWLMCDANESCQIEALAQKTQGY